MFARLPAALVGRILLGPLHRVGAVTVHHQGGVLLALGSKFGGSVSPAHKVLIANALAKEFQTLLRLDVFHGDRPLGRKLGPGTDLVHIVGSLSGISVLQLRFSSQQQNLGIAHHAPGRCVEVTDHAALQYAELVVPVSFTVILVHHGRCAVADQVIHRHDGILETVTIHTFFLDEGVIEVAGRDQETPGIGRAEPVARVAETLGA